MGAKRTEGGKNMKATAAVRILRVVKGRPAQYLLPIFLSLAMTACGGPSLTHQEMTLAYQEALAATKAKAWSDWDDDPGRLAAAIDRLREYFRDVSGDSVQRLTRQVYAPDAFLCDTLHIARGAEKIEAYFAITAERVDSMQVTILDYSSAGPEVYARWQMTVAADNLAGGQPVTTFGLTHFRFNREGKVILHQDFWDASAGFFELLPWLKGVIPRIRGRV